MRIAFSGSHRVGKSTLLDAVSERLPAYATYAEPYELLEEDGYELSHPPTADDFERQLDRSLELLEDSRTDILFDRCPIDFIAYLAAVDPDLDVAGGVDDIRAAMSSLDLVVVVAIEEPDRVRVPDADDRRLRREVDDKLRELLDGDPFGLGVQILEVGGSVEARLRSVLAAL